MKAYLIHGFNVKDRGANTTDKLRPHLEALGYDVTELDYPWFGRVKTRLCNKAMAMIAAETVEDGSMVFGHSNGCAVIYYMAQFNSNFSHITLINPALDAKKVPAGDCGVDVWYASNDQPVRIAKYIPYSPWGDQGRVGYVGSDPRVQNHPLGTIGHSGAFKKPALLARIVATAHNRRIDEALSRYS